MSSVGLFVAQAARADSLSSSVFVRADEDHTVVVSPRAHLSKHVAERSQVDVTYAADIWTSASIDIRASATQPVTEQRDELDLALSQEVGELTLSGSYRYSIEHDYRSHGVSAGGALDLAEHNTTVALNAFAFLDTVGRAGMPSFARALTTWGIRASLTQVLTQALLVQLNYELGHLKGYQSSPYRMVGIGGNGIGCKGASLCLPEHEPDLRTRQAAAVSLRYGFAEAFAAGAGYRFYIDDWRLSSHTFQAHLSWAAAEHTQFALLYRFYLQSGVSFYQRVYTQSSGPNLYTTRDREQSPMHDQHVSLQLEHALPLDRKGHLLAIRASLGVLQYEYADFAGLSSVRAYEVTLAVGLEN
jgi:hypothetical protein